MQEVLTIRVFIEDCHEVKSHEALARMITFSGDCECDNFKGTILSGGVDTQRKSEGQPFTLSARYMLSGVDKEGQPCHIFIENNGVDMGGDMKTTPHILTDSRSLAFLNNAICEGSIESWEKGVIIHIFIK